MKAHPVRAFKKGDAMEGSKPGLDEMYCYSCGAIIKKLAELCVHCGVRVGPPVSAGESVFTKQPGGVAGEEYSDEGSDRVGTSTEENRVEGGGPGLDEMYCYSCGAIIKKARRAMCPLWGSGESHPSNSATY